MVIGKMKRRIYVPLSLVSLMWGAVFAAIFNATPVSASSVRTIGYNDWNTEENDFDSLLRLAKRREKPLLIVFSAAWCGPCQSVKHRVFATREFSKVAERVILAYIEQTTPAGKKYCKTFGINRFPTFRLYDGNGKILTYSSPRRSVQGFLNWVTQATGGSSQNNRSRQSSPWAGSNRYDSTSDRSGHSRPRPTPKPQGPTVQIIVREGEVSFKSQSSNVTISIDGQDEGGVDEVGTVTLIPGRHSFTFHHPKCHNETVSIDIKEKGYLFYTRHMKLKSEE